MKFAINTLLYIVAAFLTGAWNYDHWVLRPAQEEDRGLFAVGAGAVWPVYWGFYGGYLLIREGGQLALWVVRHDWSAPCPASNSPKAGMVYSPLPGDLAHVCLPNRLCTLHHSPLCNTLVPGYANVYVCD